MARAETDDLAVDRRQFLALLGAEGLGLGLALGCGDASAPGSGDLRATDGDRGAADDAPGLPADSAAVTHDAVHLPPAAAISDEELVTVADTWAALTWVTEYATETAIHFGPDAAAQQARRLNNDPTRFHYLEIQGLLPGRTYHYRTCRQSDSPSTSKHSPGSFTTLAPPPAAPRFTFATLNDIHAGCDRVGLIFGRGNPAIWPETDRPAWRFCLEEAIRRINGLGVDFVIVKGDLTTNHHLQEHLAAREILDRLHAPYYPLRGNHDVRQSNAEDYFLTVFSDKLPSRDSSYRFTHEGYHFVCCDSCDPIVGNPLVSSKQLSWLGDQLEAQRSLPTMIFLHHTVTVESTPLFSLLGPNRQQFIEVLKGHDNIVGIFSGHSHRDAISHESVLGDIPCVETASTLHYPLGFNVYRVWEQGYMQLGYCLSRSDCLQWRKMTRGLYGGAASEFLFLPASARCFVYSF